ncbi:MAG: lysophospholipase [Gemmatimonadaceae bacterium]|nr:lysophospholipase [Gemmatimonadaceae bacterium]
MPATLTITPQEEKIPTTGDLEIFIRSWRPEGKARAVVAICHGVLSHSGYYRWVAEQLVASGYAVYALDLRGRGLSDGDRYYLTKFSDYTDDLDALVQVAKSREHGLPVFVLGHSAGGVVSSVYALDNQRDLAGLICESFAFQVYAPDFALAVLKGLSHVAPHAHVLKLPIDGFSRDTAAVDAMKADPLLDHEVQPTRTVAELVHADERLKKEFPKMTLPVFIMHGTADIVTKPSGSQFFFDTVGSSDKTLKLYDGHAHDLLNDIGKEEVMSDITAWLDARTVA